MMDDDGHEEEEFNIILFQTICYDRWHSIQFSESV